MREAEAERKESWNDYGRGEGRFYQLKWRVGFGAGGAGWVSFESLEGNSNRSISRAQVTRAGYFLELRELRRAPSTVFHFVYLTLGVLLLLMIS
jgi:hypothetical protein